VNQTNSPNLGIHSQIGKRQQKASNPQDGYAKSAKVGQTVSLKPQHVEGTGKQEHKGLLQDQKEDSKWMRSGDGKWMRNWLPWGTPRQTTDAV